MIERELTFSWRWDNLEAVIEFFEAKPKPWIGDIKKTTGDLKKGAVNAFATLFARIPLRAEILHYIAPAVQEPGSMSGLMALYSPIVSAVTDAIHSPIARLISLHPDSDSDVAHLSVVFAVTFRDRIKGGREPFDVNEVKAKYRA